MCLPLHFPPKPKAIHEVRQRHLKIVLFIECVIGSVPIQLPRFPVGSLECTKRSPADATWNSSDTEDDSQCMFVKLLPNVIADL